MKHGEKRAISRLRYSIMLFFKMMIVAFATASFLLALFEDYAEAAFPGRGNIVLGLLYFLILFWTMMTYQCFKIGKARLKELGFSLFIALCLTNFLGYLVLSMLADRMLAVVPMLLLSLRQLVFGITVYVIANGLYPYLFKPRCAIFITDGTPYDQSILDKMRESRQRFDICQIVCQSEGYVAITEAAAAFDTVVLGSLDPNLAAALTTFGFVQKKELYIIPAVNDIVLQSAQTVQLGDSMLLFCRNQALSFEQRFLKRGIDLVISIVGLALTWPLMLATALAVKLQDGGPVFFRQERYTKGGKVFTLIKFRSMVTDAEKHGAQLTVNNDPRITPVGRFIRAVRLDELPQLFNILAGHMSFVGPRAERIENAEAYTKQMPAFSYRLMVKAGLTGYAQVYGKYNTSPEDKARMDIFYISNYSLLLDLKLILYTVRIIFMKDSTDGFAGKSLSGENSPETEEKSE